MENFTRSIVCLSLLFLGACKTSRLAKTPVYDKMYENAIKNSMYVENAKINGALIDITPNNTVLKTKVIGDAEHVLVVTWMPAQFNYPDSGSFTLDRNLWVTAYPELLVRMKNKETKDPDMRLRQLFGLPPNKSNKIFMEFYVKKDDLFRACPDKEITDKKCNLCFTSQDSLDNNHIQWINATRIYNYFGCDLYSKYPWTQLGYTYDWNPENKSHVGLSEFVVRPTSTIHIVKLRKTNDYLKEF